MKYLSRKAANNTIQSTSVLNKSFKTENSNKKSDNKLNQSVLTPNEIGIIQAEKQREREK